MTSQPQVPGASAVYLFREETTEDNLHMWSTYVRLKVLNEGGKKYGDVELRYAAGGPAALNIGDIAGRTIHPDGSVIPFTGKLYEKLIVKGQGYRYMAKVFSCPMSRSAASSNTATSSATRTTTLFRPSGTSSPSSTPVPLTISGGQPGSSSSRATIGDS